MLDHFHIGKGAVRDLILYVLDITHQRLQSAVIYRVFPTTHIAARLQLPTSLKVPANTKTLQDMRVSFEKVACNGCARYVPLCLLLCAKQAIVITASDDRDAEVSVSQMQQSFPVKAHT